MREDRARRLVLGVLKEILRSSRAPGFVLAGGSPEARLLEGWIRGEGLPVRSPSSDAVARARRLFRTLEEEDPVSSRSPTPSPRDLAARALAQQAGWILTGSATKTQLLLRTPAPGEPLLPLGDLYASEVLEMVGECTLPHVLTGVYEAQLQDVDRSLQRWLEEDLPPDRAFSGLPSPLREEVALEAASAGGRWIHRPLIPKLRGRTLGIDLDL